MRHSAIRALCTIREAASESSPFIRTVARTVGNSGIANAGNIAEQVRKELRISSFQDSTQHGILNKTYIIRVFFIKINCLNLSLSLSQMKQQN